MFICMTIAGSGTKTCVCGGAGRSLHRRGAGGGDGPARGAGAALVGDEEMFVQRAGRVRAQMVGGKPRKKKSCSLNSRHVTRS